MQSQPGPCLPSGATFREVPLETRGRLSTSLVLGQEGGGAVTDVVPSVDHGVAVPTQKCLWAEHLGFLV